MEKNEIEFVIESYKKEMIETLLNKVDTLVF